MPHFHKVCESRTDRYDSSPMHMTLQEQQPRALAEAHPLFVDPKVTAKLTKVSIVIPVYNEEATVQDLIKLVVEAPLPEGLRREVICVNDCSKDGTAKKLDELPTLFPQCDFRIFHKPV